jgi:mannose-6-phosphate isomerase
MPHATTDQAALLERLRGGPLPLTGTSFTPCARTPWGGREIARRYKSWAPEAAARAGVWPVIGEAWEFSAGPEFPSVIDAAHGLTLVELLRRHPEAVFSPAWLASRPADCTLLVKLLNAAEPLSLQVHPADDDPALAPDECGKPESWLILDAEPGAGIYLGFSRAMPRSELRRAIESGAPIEPLMHFEPVKAGDYFEIEPGVPHAIGAGLTLLEPQRVLAGRRGKTYRLWDWGRRYDSAGQPVTGAGAGSGGKARELHLEDGLRLVDPERQHGAAFAASLRREPARRTVGPGVTALAFPDNGHYQLTIVRGEAGGEARWRARDGYAALLMLSGELVSHGITLVQGRPALAAAAAMPLGVCFTRPGDLAVVTPAGVPFEMAP